MLKQEGYDLMGAAFEVYNEQGYGLSEEIYQESLEIELQIREIRFESKAPLEVFQKGRPLRTRYRPDLLVCEEIIVESKAVTELCSGHESQLFNYMRVSRKPVGYLINFGPKTELEWRRYVLSDLKPKRQNRR